ncbi:nucleotidyltransferase family protein [Mesorhizobium sp. B283B1A]|uniref:nucleotidyltransferase family protein n=1 Tax=Mesorhizobium TaxID=68287 RepID=UPI001CD0DA70|nr:MULTISPECIES: nucleotidyltransferase family protein [Mesorhizobium]MCA0046420.1 nucleotidyltransferase family protein [Mesorhizobium sp. B283B1A]UQS64245.1 nucleotidyltransferase family protein [Mesorhizobium opportunistum]
MTNDPVPENVLVSLPRIDPKAAPTLKNAEAEVFYTEAIHELTATDIPFLVAGTYAVSAYTGVMRQTKDLDIFCKAGDYARILAHFKQLGYAVEIEDDRWLGKVFKGTHFFDVIFGSANGMMPVGDQWLEHARQTELLGSRVRVIGPTELIWSKCFIQDRGRHDGADITHTILKAHDQVDWHRLLSYLEVHWEVLLMQLLNFRWIYPTERDHIPAWLLDELLDRLAKQRQLPPPRMKICRGRLLSQTDYEIDVKEWGFAGVGGAGEFRDG